MSGSGLLIVGVGSPHGDDQAGWLVVDHLAGRLAGETAIVRRAESPVDVLDWLDGVDRLMLSDACRGLGRVGAARRFSWPVPETVDVAWLGAHDFPLPAVLRLAERLGRLPKQVEIWAIEGVAGEPSAAVSPGVRRSIDQVVEEMERAARRGAAWTA